MGSGTPSIFPRGHLNAQIYINEALEPIISPYIRWPNSATIQQGNARPHIVAVWLRFLHQYSSLPCAIACRTCLRYESQVWYVTYPLLLVT